MSGGGGGIIIIKSLRATGMLTPEENEILNAVEERLCAGLVEKGRDTEIIGHIAKAIGRRP